jgi:hypothetical protein
MKSARQDERPDRKGDRTTWQGARADVRVEQDRIEADARADAQQLAKTQSDRHPTSGTGSIRSANPAMRSRGLRWGNR